MSEKSDRMLELLTEIATLKEIEEQSDSHDVAQNRKRRREIRREIRQIGDQSKGDQ